MQDLILNATTRDVKGTNACRRMRRKGQLPGVVYGHGQQRMITLEAHDFNLLLRKMHAEHAVVQCRVDNEDFSVLIKDVQRDGVLHTIEHVDFLVVDLDEIVTVAVPLKIVGEAEGVKTFGGVLEVLRRDVEVECKARDIPATLNVDVSALRIHDVLCVRDLPQLPGIVYMLPGDVPLLTVAAPTLQEEAAPSEAAAPGAAVEPEVITAKAPADEGLAEGARKE